MIDVLLKLIVFIFLLLGYLIFLFSYRVFNGTSTRLILLSKFEDKDNGNLVPDVIFSCDSNTYILLCMGRIKLERSLRRGTIVVDGDESLAEQFTNYFTSI